MSITFQKAVKAQEKLRMALDGPPGSGKTWTALLVATYLAEREEGRIAVIDSERSSAKKYASDFDFDHLTLPDFSPHTYTEAVQAAVQEGYAVIIVDSLSHAWEGTLDLKDAVQKRSKSNDGFGAWREVTPVHNELIDAMLRAPAHVIVTMRTKMEHLVEKNESTGKNKVSKIGLKPVQRDGVDYEFDIVGDMDQENTLTVSKSRCYALSGMVIRRPNKDLAEVLWNWLEDGEPSVSREQAAEITGLLNAIGDQADRTEAKRQFVASYGVPELLAVSRFEDSLKYAKELAVWGGVQVSAPAPENSATAPESEGTEPPANGTSSAREGIPKATDEQLQALKDAIEALPENCRDACTAEIQRTFGDKATEYLTAEIKAAIDIAQQWPTGGSSEKETDEPVPPRERPLNAKQRALVAYGHGHGIEEPGLVALASFMLGTFEPRPLGELDDAAVTSVTALVDEVKAGTVVLEPGNNGVLMARQVAAV